MRVSFLRRIADQSLRYWLSCPQTASNTTVRDDLESTHNQESLRDSIRTRGPFTASSCHRLNIPSPR